MKSNVQTDKIQTKYTVEIYIFIVYFTFIKGKNAYHCHDIFFSLIILHQYVKRFNSYNKNPQFVWRKILKIWKNSMFFHNCPEQIEGRLCQTVRFFRQYVLFKIQVVRYLTKTEKKKKMFFPLTIWVRIRFGNDGILTKTWIILEFLNSKKKCILLNPCPP